MPVAAVGHGLPGRRQRPQAVAELQRSRKRRRTGPSAHAHCEDSWRAAGSARGRAWDASAVCSTATKKYVTDACVVESAVDNMTLRGSNHLLYLP